ncbi:TonB-dependent receptor [Segetibacter sp. 3557_3]|uniref:TonB-dependent receptor n=1 Tax=Segetibacter sp. 3557_3 TaxID=2547429 RepID=UPI00105917FC|nr:carboxypeptidase regulatory-like domain-containing protein [Segetibacter sp. 3557_3]TDH28726.1 TonB-dependent receptor [Segetibacter sp. 3557_3]
MRSKFTISVVLIFLLSPVFSWAQNATQAVVLGMVSSPDGPVQGATLSVKNESTGFTATTLTNKEGGYIFNQLPLGSPYSITVSFVGFKSEKKTGITLNQGDRIDIGFDLIRSEGTLTEVVVTTNTLRRNVANVGAATTISPKDLNTLPVNGRNFTTLIDLSPVANGTSIGGQLQSSTNFTIDGMTARGTIAGGNTSGAYSISIEAIREFKVVNNEYDVTEGRAGGGTISTVTKSGTNTFSGSVFGFLRHNKLSSSYDIRGNKRNQPFSTAQYGVSMGGPIVKDKAHFFFVWDHQQDSRPLNNADIRTPADEAAFRVTESTLERFTQVAREKYGVGNTEQFGSFDKRRSTDALFGRIDWQLNSKNLLSIRNNYVSETDNLSEGDNSGINAIESYIDRKKMNNSLILSLRTSINPKLTNEFKAQQFLQHEFVIPSPELPSASIPRAIVENVTSTGQNGTTYTNSIQIGGQRFSPEWFKGTVYQAVNNLYLNTSRVKYTFGVDLMYTRMHNVYGSEMNGRFFFTGLDNFQNRTPYRYVREIAIVDDPSTILHQMASGAYAQMETKLGRGVNLLAGIRVDNTQYLNGADYNAIADKQLNINTSNKINTTQLQPRFELMWDVSEKKTDFIRFGAGIFGSNLNPYSMINNILFDGTKVASVDLTTNLPSPDFIGYRQDPTTAPGKELFDIPGVEKLVTINTNSKDVKVPTVYKASLTYNHIFGTKLRMGVSAYATLARKNYMYVDRNMVDQPFFTIEQEANRGVYVPAATINNRNGVANWVNSRKTNTLGRVLELISDGKKNQYAIVVDGTYRYYKDGQITASYTWSDSRDNTSYNGNVANTATLNLMVKDDPRDLRNMAYADNQFRTKVVVYANAPSIKGITLGLRFSGIGGTRYSLAVAGNMNGDFVNSNDLAYIYDPKNPSTPKYIADGINAILDNPDVEQSLKDYITRSFGEIAERNGGINGFFGTFDLRLAKKVMIHRKHGVELSMDLFNVANTFNKKRGVNRNLGKQNIYNVTSFNTEAATFGYRVNTTSGVSPLGGTPFQAQVGLRYSF